MATIIDLGKLRFHFAGEWAVGTTYEIKDEPGCPVPSEMQIRAEEKHGYSGPASVPWP